MPLNVAIEGSIASGKSSLIKELRILAENDRWNFYPEQVERWKRLGPRRINLLKMFYQNPGKYALALQTQVMISKVEQMQCAWNSYPTPIAIFERSFESSAEVFAKANPLFGEVEKTISQNLSDFLLENTEVDSDVIIYLETNPEQCLKRISKRDRPEERKVDLNYLENLHDHYRTFIANSKIPVKIILVDNPEKSVKQVALEAYEIIKSLLEVNSDSSSDDMEAGKTYSLCPPHFVDPDNLSLCALNGSQTASTEEVSEAAKVVQDETLNVDKV